MASHKWSLACLLSLMLGLTLTLAFVPTWAFATGDSDTSVGESELALTDGDDTSSVDGATDGAPADTSDETSLEHKSGEDEDELEANTSTPDEKGSETEALQAPTTSEPTNDEAAHARESAVVADDVQTEEDVVVGVTYRTHVQRKGWMSWVRNGEMAGTQGAALRMEAVSIKLDKPAGAPAGGIEYRVHAQKKGWMGWVRDGADAGTTDQGLRLEALQIRLYGDLAKEYDVYYSVHAQKRGWMAWAKNDESSAGTAGQALRLEAVRVKLVKKGEQGPGSEGVQYNKPFDGGPVVSMSAHVQRIGWQGAVGNGAISGTMGRSLRMEALRLSLPGLDVPGGVQLRGHVQSYGWSGWVNGYAGSEGKGKRLEAVQIRLTGEAAGKYQIYYRVHVAHLGWMGWAKDGEEAGTSGMACRIEAVQVKLVAKGAAAPTEKGSVAERYLSGTNIRYNAYCQTFGWRGEVANGATAGTSGQRKRVEAFTVRLDGGSIGGGVNYSAYVGSSWQATQSNNATAGTIGQAKPVQAIRISLTGRAAAMYNVYYRVHMQKAGWLGWAANGQTAGAPGAGMRVESMQVRLVPKGTAAPGSTANHEVNKAYFDDAMTKKAQGYSSPTGWLILVDTDHTQLAVFRGSQGNWTKYDQWIVSVGAPNTPSKRGVFAVGSRGYSFGHGYTCYYWTEWSGAYLFHSIKYNEGTFDVQDGTLGGHVSMGCVRMQIDRAKWIYDNMPTGTTVVVY